MLFRSLGGGRRDEKEPLSGALLGVSLENVAPISHLANAGNAFIDSGYEGYVAGSCRTNDECRARDGSLAGAPGWRSRISDPRPRCHDSTIRQKYALWYRNLYRQRRGGEAKR